MLGQTRTTNNLPVAKPLFPLRGKAFERKTTHIYDNHVGTTRATHGRPNAYWSRNPSYDQKPSRKTRPTIKSLHEKPVLRSKAFTT
jgi:hypothetical protein